MKSRCLFVFSAPLRCAATLGGSEVRRFLPRLGLVLGFVLTSGCAKYGVLVNEAQSDLSVEARYSVKGHVKRNANATNDVAFTLAFSGGGTRAAAFSYGVLTALRDAQVASGNQSFRLLDEVDLISSVSGGSFTAAYYGLYGDQIFQTFEEDFLRRDVQGRLIRTVLNPLNWFSTKARTELAIADYDRHVFKGATFADMVHDDRPLIAINASDLSNGVRFSFLQEYFDLLCSNLSNFPISRAVAASSAVPVLFSPVVIENHPDCYLSEPDWFADARRRAVGNYELALTVEGLSGYFDKESKQFAHLVDGGITDNLGVRAQLEIIELSGGAATFVKRTNQQTPRRLVLIVVNAATEPEYRLSQSHRVPHLEETIGAVTDIQLHRYNAASLDVLRESIDEWAEEISKPDRPVEAYFIELGFEDIEKRERRLFFNRIPTSFALSNEQVDALIEAGRNTLVANAEFQRLIGDLRNE